MCNKCIQIIQMMHDLAPDTGSVYRQDSDGVAEAVIHAIAVDAATKFTRLQSDRMMQKLGIPPQFQIASDRAIVDAFGDALKDVLEDYAIPLAYWFGREETSTFVPMREEVSRMINRPLDEQDEEKLNRLKSLVKSLMGELKAGIEKIDPGASVELMALGPDGPISPDGDEPNEVDPSIWLDEA